MYRKKGLAFIFLISMMIGGFLKAQDSTSMVKDSSFQGPVKEDNFLPFAIPDDQIRPLRKLENKDFQQKFEKRLKQNKEWSRLISQKKMAVGLVDLSDPYNTKFARVNGDVMMYAASLPKLAILLAAVQSLEDGTLEETPDVLQDLRLMISQSDNPAATRTIDRLGFEKISDVLTDPRYELYDPKIGGGLWVGKRYAKYGKRYPDPYMGISHGASVTQVCRFYYLLAMGKLVNRERSREILDFLEDPEIHHKFVNTLEKVVPDAKLYRKSGTWKKWHSDSVLVWGPVWRRYIVAALVENANGEKILRELIPAVEEVLKVNLSSETR
jgi:beta-lactamase class A